jgi:transposase
MARHAKEQFMHYLGIDVHKKVVAACLLDEDGQIVKRARFDLSAQRLSAFIGSLPHPCKVVLEATTNTWAVVDVLTPLVDEVVVSNPMRTKAIASAKIKCDRVDALVLAQLLRTDFLPRVWQPDAVTRQARALAHRRSVLVRDRTRLKNRIHSLLAQRLIVAPATLFSCAARQWLAELSLPLCARGELDTLLVLLDTIEKEISQLQQPIDQLAWNDPAVRLLMTLPGVNVAVAQGLVAAIGDIDRFRTPAHLAAYLGLVPSTHQSAEHCYHGPITKHGNSQARWLLSEAAQCVASHPGPLGHFFRKLATRKHRNVAVIATARKLAEIAWHMLIKNEPYRYATPQATADKLARLRVSATGCRRRSSTKGQPRSPYYGSADPSRPVKSLPEVLQSESLPPIQPLAPGEVRMLQDSLCLPWQQSLQQPSRRPGARRARKPPHPSD